MAFAPDGALLCVTPKGVLRIPPFNVSEPPRAPAPETVVAHGTPAAERVPFRSPRRTIYFDKVTDVSAEVELVLSKPNTRPPWVNPDTKTYNILGQALPVMNGTSIGFSIPLKTLGLSRQPGMEIPGDIGILKGDGSHTTFRACWHNQATGLTQDVPREAIPTPSLWGRRIFEGMEKRRPMTDRSALSFVRRRLLYGSICDALRDPFVAGSAP